MSSGRWTSRVSSGRVTACTATRSRLSTKGRGICCVVKVFGLYGPTRPGLCSSVCSVRLGCLRPSAATTAPPSPPRGCMGSAACRCGGSAWVSSTRRSPPGTPRRTHATSGCTGRSRPRPRGRQPAAGERSSGGSICSARSTTRSDPTRLLTGILRPVAGSPRPGPIRARSPSRSTQDT